MMSLRILIIALVAILQSADAFSLEYSKCSDSDYNDLCYDSTASEVIDAETGAVYYLYRNVSDFYFYLEDYDDIEVETKARCEYCRPGAGGPPVARKGATNQGFIGQYFSVPISKYYPSGSIWECQIYGPLSDGPGKWDQCRSIYDRISLRVKCTFDKTWPDGNPSC